MLILVAMIAGLTVLAASGNEFGFEGLSFVAGGLIGGAVVAVAAHNPRIRKLALVLGVAALPAWIVLGILSAVFSWSGWLDALFGTVDGPGFSKAAAAVQGFATCAAIQGLIGLFGPSRRR